MRRGGMSILARMRYIGPLGPPDEVSVDPHQIPSPSQQADPTLTNERQLEAMP